MKQLSYVFTLILLVGFSFQGNAQLLTESFETDGEGIRYTSNTFNSACHDYFNRTDDADGATCITNLPNNENGTFYWAGEDCDQAVGGEGIITLNPLAVTGFTLDVDILLAEGRANDGRFEPSDYLILEYNMDGGGWNIFGALYGNNDVSLNGNLTVDTDLDGFHGPGGAEVNSTNFQNFNFPIPVTGNSLQVRIRVLSSGGTEEIVFDYIRINGTAACTDPTVPTLAQSPATVCVGGSASLNITGTLNSATEWHVYTGSCGGTSIGSTATGTFNIPGPITVPTTYFVRGEGGCVTPGTCGTITITPQAVVNGSVTAPADLCVDAGVQTGLTGGSPAGGVYSGPGVTDDGNGTTYSFDPAAAGVGTHTITYTPTGSCATAGTDQVEVFALPSVTFTAIADQCLNAGVQLGTLGGSPTGGTYSGAGVTDLGDGISYTFNPTVAGVGTHTVTYSFTDANGCSGSATDQIEVFALPTVNFTALADLCITDGVQAGLGGGTPPGGVYSGAGVTDDGNGMTYSFDPAVAGVGTHTISYTFTDGNGCTTSASDDVEVFGATVGVFTAPADLCVDAGVQAGLGGGTPVGGVYSGPGVTDDGNGNTYSFDPAAAGVGTHTITYTPAGGCSTPANDQVEVFALPTVTFTALADLCVDAGVQTALGGGNPTGGVYSGPGVTDDGNGNTYSFDPAAAGVGTHTITYTFTNGNGCTGTATDQVEVFSLPLTTFVALSDLCIDAGVQAGLGGGNPTGGIYSGPGVTDDGNGSTYSFDPAVAGVGTHTISYTITNANGCTGIANDQVEVFALPTVTFTGPGSFCSTDGVQAGLGGGNPTGGIYSGPGVTDDGNGMTYSFDPGATGAGTFTITYTYTNTNGCTASANDNVTVTTGGAVTAVCQDVTIYLDASGNASITAADIDGGSSVGCGTLNLAASQTAFTCADVPVGATPTNDLVISGVYDGPLTGGIPKGVELYVINNIADLSQYGLGSANNGGGTDGEEFTFPAVAATAGQYIYVASEAPQFTNWFGFAPDYTDPAMSINGDDAVELFFQGGVIDVFGDINTDGTGEAWEYQDGWAYRVDDTGNDGSAWTPSNWTYSGINVLDNETSNATAATPFPTGTFSMTVATPTSVTLTVTDGLGGSATCTANVTVLDTISPVADCQDATVYLDATGNASITAADVTNLGSLYFTTFDNDIYQASKDGTGTPATLYTSGQGTSNDLLVGIDYIPETDELMWANGLATEITTAPADGTGPITILPNSQGTGANAVHSQDVDFANNRYFFSANQNGVYVAALDGTGTPTLINGTVTGLNTVEYDAANTRIFTNDVGNSEIYSMNDDGTGLATLFTSADGVSGPRDIVYDPSQDVIYWTNRDASNIMVGNADGTGTPTIVYSGLSGLYEIELDPTTGLLYWVEFQGGNAEVMSAPKDGTGTPVVLHSGNFGSIRGLSLENAGNTDNCSATTSTIDVNSFDCSNAGTSVTVTMTVADASGNTTTCTSQVTVLDTISPTVTCPVDIIQDQDAGVCTADITVPNITTGDNCTGETIGWVVSGATTATGSGQPGLQTFNVGVSTVDVTATDASGNTTNCSFTVTVNDTVAPVLPVLADSVADCSVTLAAPTTTDNCSGTITGTTTDPTTVTAQGTTVITWTFDDGAGNVITATQNVIINDAVLPTASNIDTAFVECIGDAAIDVTLVDDEADNCTAAPVVAYVGDVASNGTGCNDTITRTYSVTDDAGNSINVEQIIVLNDVTPPTASTPVTLSVVCLADVPSTAGATSWVTDEADNCGNPIVTWLSDVSSNGTGCNDTITRTFEVADACGNSIQVEQLIIVNDDDVPVADVATLADITGTCDVTPAAPTATDNCAGTLNGVPDVTFPISTVGTTVVTWTYTDNCGNTTSQTQNVTVTGVDVGTTMASDGITMIATNINPGVTYQWIDCETGSPVAGATNVNFTPPYGSDFAVVVTENGCVDTSDCVNSTVGLEQLQLGDFIMYPNPTETGSFTIQLGAELKEVSVLDMTGRLVEVNVNLTEKTVNVSSLVNGAYMVRVVTQTEQELVGTIRVQ